MEQSGCSENEAKNTALRFARQNNQSIPKDFQLRNRTANVASQSLSQNSYYNAIVASKKKNHKPDYYAKRNDNDLLIRCEHCFDHEYEDNDNIVMCDRCNCSVHISCYRNDDSFARGIPKGDWFCLRCKQPEEKRDNIMCLLCRGKEGLLLHCEISSGYGAKQWIHATCLSNHPNLFLTGDKGLYLQRKNTNLNLLTLMPEDKFEKIDAM